MQKDGKIMKHLKAKELFPGFPSRQLNRQNLCESALKELGLGLGYWYLVGLWCAGLVQVLAGGKLSVKLLSSTAIRTSIDIHSVQLSMS